jgi:EAL domain-containing protein (putative c-di-GMP-specific phosphodiesterase class I)
MYDIDPKNVTLEILEDIAIENNDEIIEQINTLESRGYAIAIDDFGVESSNMSKLVELNASFLKIDGSFIKDVHDNEKHLHIVEALVYIAQKLDMEIVAEFVHCKEVHDVVKKLGIQYSQGYYFGEPKKNI